MTRRADPARIAAAWEAGTRGRLRDELRVPNVEELLEAWADEARGRGLVRTDRAYWDAAWPWLLERAHRPPPARR